MQLLSQVFSVKMAYGQLITITLSIYKNFSLGLLWKALHKRPDKLPFTLSDAMGRILMDEPLRPGEGILHHPEGVDLMPADIQLSGMEVSLVNAMSRETILRQYLDTVKGQYSHILIDCQPSLGMLTVNALAAANRVIIPVQAEYLPAKGLEQLLQTVNKVKRQITASCLSNGALYLCAPGVNAIKYLPSAIRSLSVERLLGEYDMDQIRQEQYSAALRRMQDTLKPLGIPYIQQMWNPAYNGIDDYKLHSRWLPLAA